MSKTRRREENELRDGISLKACIAVHNSEEEGDCEGRVTGLGLGVFYCGVRNGIE